MSLRINPAADAVRNALAPARAPAPAKTTDAAVLDAAATAAAEKARQEQEAAEAARAAAAAAVTAAPVFDAVESYEDSDTALKAVAAVQEWAETAPSELDEGEGSGDRLFSLLAGIADGDMDGEISEAEAEVINQAANVAADYLVAKGVPEDDAVKLLTEFDNELAESVQDLVLTALPDGDTEAATEIDDFVFGDGSDEAALDAAGATRVVGADGATAINFNGVVLDAVTFGSLAQAPDWMKMTGADIREFVGKAGGECKVFDATYKKKLVVRRGKKVRINKRVSGHVRLSAKQKIAVRKMLRKSHSAVAKIRRSKSVKVRKRAGL